jgi:methylmalonyl-CoA mutase C-terminal domain/subunit
VSRRPRVVLAKPGLDGHDRGVHIVARILRDEGFEVIMTGLRASPEQIAQTAVDEDADVVGLSVLSGAHNDLAAATLRCLRDRGLEIPVVVGGTIGPSDQERLRDEGVAAVFPVGSSRDQIARRMHELANGDADRGEAARDGG